MQILQYPIISIGCICDIIENFKIYPENTLVARERLANRQSFQIYMFLMFMDSNIRFFLSIFKFKK
jgi:hypothetical protein